MKKWVSVFLSILLVTSCLWGCDSDSGGGRSKKKGDTLVEMELHTYDSFFATTWTDHGTVSFTLTGELPEEDEVNGSFDGKIQIEDEAGTVYTYEGMQFFRFEELLLLIAEEGQFACLYSPDAPENVLFVDYQWTIEVEKTELVAYLNNALTETEHETIGTYIRQIEGVESATYISAQKALDEFTAASGSSDALSGVDVSQLRSRYQVKVAENADMEATIEQLENVVGVQEVRTPTDIVQIRFFTAAETAEDLTLQLTQLSSFEPDLEKPVQEDMQVDENVPQAYVPIIQDYKKVVEYRLSDAYTSGTGVTLSSQMQALLNADYGLSYRWDNMLSEMEIYSEFELTPADYGYVLMDMNADESPELIWTNRNRDTVFAIFTLKNGQPALLDCYWSRNTAVILDDGTVYTMSSDSWDTIEFVFYVVDSQTPCLKRTSAFGCADGVYYRETSGQRMSSNEELYYSMLSSYPYEFGWNWYLQEFTALQ